MYRVLGKCSAKGKFTRNVAGVGDIICVAIKKSLPTCQLDDKKVHKCVIIRTKQPIKTTGWQLCSFRQKCGGVH